MGTFSDEGLAAPLGPHPGSSKPHDHQPLRHLLRPRCSATSLVPLASRRLRVHQANLAPKGARSLQRQPCLLTCILPHRSTLGNPLGDRPHVLMLRASENLEERSQIQEGGDFLGGSDGERSTGSPAVEFTPSTGAANHVHATSTAAARRPLVRQPHMV